MKSFPLVLFLFFSNFLSFACSCNDIPFKEATEWADEVFLGRLIEIKEVESEISELNPGQKYTRLWYAKFEVIKKWKGSTKKIITVYQPSTSCDASFNFLNTTYLVYAKKERIFKYFNEENTKEGLTTWLCSRSRKYLYVNELENSDYFKLNELFPNNIKLYRHINFHWKFLLLGFILFSGGIFLGYKIKKNKPNKANLQVL